MASIRPETADDHVAARHVHERAFAPSLAEARLVDALRAEAAHVAALCLVAEEDSAIVGHIAFSRARLPSGDEVLALAPVAVVPERQGAGVGSALIREALQRSRATGHGLVLVLGHPAYYPRFGFEPAGALGIEAPWDVPPEAWMALRLPAYRPSMRGLVAYADAFAAVG